MVPLLGEYDTMAVNFMTIFFQGYLDYAASWHYDLLPRLAEIRTYQNENRPRLFGPKEYAGIDFAGKFYEGNIATSGMYAACIGLHLGYNKIVMAGIPFDGTGHFYSPPSHKEKKFLYMDMSKKSWDSFRDKADNKVRAVSGCLVECFGELTDEWLKEI